MRHLKAHRKLGRTSEHRLSMLRNLATSLINSRDERIVTTLPKAKELRPFLEKAITLSRRAQNLDDEDSEIRAVHLRRQAAGFFHAGNMQQAPLAGKRGQVRPPRTAGVAALKRLFNELGERYKDRPGGYTRILKLGTREGDNAELAIIELVGNPREQQALEAARKRAARAASAKKKATGRKRRDTSKTKEKEDNITDTKVEASSVSESKEKEENSSSESTPEKDEEQK